VVPLADIKLTSFTGASWGEDGSILVSEAFGKGLQRIPANGGRPEVVAPLGSGESPSLTGKCCPVPRRSCLPIPAAPDLEAFTIEVLTVAGRDRTIILRGGQSPRYLPTSSGEGHLIASTRPPCSRSRSIRKNERRSGLPYLLNFFDELRRRARVNH
jgi:hypothetical protein